MGEAGTVRAEREVRAQRGGGVERRRVGLSLRVHEKGAVKTSNNSGSVVRCSASEHESWVQALSQFQEKKAGLQCGCFVALQILRRGADQGRIWEGKAFPGESRAAESWLLFSSPY